MNEFKKPTNKKEVVAIHKADIVNFMKTRPVAERNALVQFMETERTSKNGKVGVPTFVEVAYYMAEHYWPEALENSTAKQKETVSLADMIRAL